MIGRYLQALLLAALAAVLFLGPALLPGRALVPFPPEHTPPASAEIAARGLVQADLLVGNPAGGDKYNQSLAWDRISQDRLRAGSIPLWTRDLGGGAPVVPQMGQVYMPWTWLLCWLDATTAYGPWYFLHLCVLAILLMDFLRLLGVRPAAGLVGVACLVLGLWTQARVHHNVILSAALPLFLALGCVLRLFAGGGWRVTGVLAFACGVPWLGGFAPVALQSTYLTVALALFCAVRAPRGERRGPLLSVGLALGLGALIAMPQMLPVLAAATDTARAVPSAADLARSAMSLAHALTLPWPDLLSWAAPTFYEGSIDVTYPPFASLWLLDQAGANNMNWPETAFSIGVPGFALALLALGRGRHRGIAWFFASVAALGFGLAIAAPGLLQLSAVIPGARAGDIRRFLFLCGMALPVLAALGADRWLEGARARPAVAMCAVLGVASAVLFALHCVSAHSVQDAYAHLAVPRYGGLVTVADFHRAADAHHGEGAANRAHLLATFARATLAGGFGAVLLLLCGRWRARALTALALVSVFELWHAGAGTVVAVPAARVDTPPRILQPALAATKAAAAAAQPRPRFQRLALEPATGSTRLAQPNLGAFWGLEDLALYTSLAPRSLEEFYLALEPDAADKVSVAFHGAGVGGFHAPATLRHPMLAVLGLRFVLSDRALDLPGLREVTPEGWPGREHLYERADVLARATFVTRARVVPDRTERLALLADPARDARTEVLLEDADLTPLDAPVDPAARVEIDTWADEHLALRVTCSAPGYLRIADPFDPGWTATVDGEARRLLRADHHLRAVYLEPGEHRVELRYDGPIARWPARLGLLGTLLALALLCWPRRRSA